MLPGPLKCAFGIFAMVGGALLGGFACEGERPPPAPSASSPVPPPATPSEYVQEALSVLQSGGIPPAPLGAEATRQERKDYLLAVERASRALEGLLRVQGSREVPPPSLIPPARTEEVLALGRVLAVELADAVDGGDRERASQVLRMAYRYTDFAGSESIASALCAEGVTEVLAQGLYSVRKQMDGELARQLVEVINDLLQQPYPIEEVISHELERVKAWRKSLVESKETLTVDQLLTTLAPGMGRRRPPIEPMAQELRDYLYRRTGQKDVVPPELLKEQTQLALQEVERIYEGARRGVVLPVDGGKIAQAPIASLCLAPMRTWLESAGKLPLLRKESLVYLRLYVKLLSQPLPENLDLFGEEALNPLTGHPFYYKKKEDGFDLLRVPPSEEVSEKPKRK